jgi:hypothetical protein
MDIDEILASLLAQDGQARQVPSPELAPGQATIRKAKTTIVPKKLKMPAGSCSWCWLPVSTPTPVKAEVEGRIYEYEFCETCLPRWRALKIAEVKR